jgi:hypothetical protein
MPSHAPTIELYLRQAMPAQERMSNEVMMRHQRLAYLLGGELDEFAHAYHAKSGEEPYLVGLDASAVTLARVIFGSSEGGHEDVIERDRLGPLEGAAVRTRKRMSDEGYERIALDHPRLPAGSLDFTASHARRGQAEGLLEALAAFVAAP